VGGAYAGPCFQVGMLIPLKDQKEELEFRGIPRNRWNAEERVERGGTIFHNIIPWNSMERVEYDGNIFSY